MTFTFPAGKKVLHFMAFHNFFHYCMFKKITKSKIYMYINCNVEVSYYDKYSLIIKGLFICAWLAGWLG